MAPARDSAQPPALTVPTVCAASWDSTRGVFVCGLLLPRHRMSPAPTLPKASMLLIARCLSSSLCGCSASPWSLRPRWSSAAWIAPSGSHRKPQSSFLSVRRLHWLLTQAPQYFVVLCATTVGGQRRCTPACVCGPYHRHFCPCKRRRSRCRRISRDSFHLSQDASAPSEAQPSRYPTTQRRLSSSRPAATSPTSAGPGCSWTTKSFACRRKTWPCGCRCCGKAMHGREKPLDLLPPQEKGRSVIQPLSTHDIGRLDVRMPSFDDDMIAQARPGRPAELRCCIRVSM